MLDNDVLGAAEDDDDSWDDEDDFLGDDDWEDQAALAEIIQALPDGWHLIKINNYDYRKLDEMQEWCVATCRGLWEKIRWGGYCSYSTGIKFENFIDATFFKLHWCG